MSTGRENQDQEMFENLRDCMEQILEMKSLPINLDQNSASSFNAVMTAAKEIVDMIKDSNHLDVESHTRMIAQIKYVKDNIASMLEMIKLQHEEKVKSLIQLRDAAKAEHSKAIDHLLESYKVENLATSPAADQADKRLEDAKKNLEEAENQYQDENDVHRDILVKIDDFDVESILSKLNLILLTLESTNRISPPELIKPKGPPPSFNQRGPSQTPTHVFNEGASTQNKTESTSAAKRPIHKLPELIRPKSEPIPEIIQNDPIFTSRLKRLKWEADAAKGHRNPNAAKVGVDFSNYVNDLLYSRCQDKPSVAYGKIIVYYQKLSGFDSNPDYRYHVGEVLQFLLQDAKSTLSQLKVGNINKNTRNEKRKDVADNLREILDTYKKVNSPDQIAIVYEAYKLLRENPSIAREHKLSSPVTLYELHLDRMKKDAKTQKAYEGYVVIKPGKLDMLKEKLIDKKYDIKEKLGRKF